MKNRLKYKLLFLIVFLYFGFNKLHAQNNTDLTAKINVIKKDIFVRIDAFVENNNHIYNHKLNYDLIVLKRIGKSHSYQKEARHGDFSLFPNEKKTITTLKMNLVEDQELKIYLFIRDQKQLIAQDSVKLNEINEILGTSKISEDEIEIKGLVVENVKTKIGKDFYDFFYQKYNQGGTKYSFVININEKPFIGGRGALISIEIEDQKIFEFQARPDEELLQKAAEYALKRIENYNKTRNTFEKIY